MFLQFSLPQRRNKSQISKDKIQIIFKFKDSKFQTRLKNYFLISNAFNPSNNEINLRCLKFENLIIEFYLSFEFCLLEFYSYMIPQHQLHRMRIQIILSLQIRFIIFPHKVIQQRNRDNQRDQSFVIISDHFQQFLFLV